jgi:hypothetical protein
MTPSLHLHGSRPTSDLPLDRTSSASIRRCAGPRRRELGRNGASRVRPGERHHRAHGRVKTPSMRLLPLLSVLGVAGMLPRSVPHCLRPLHSDRLDWTSNGGTQHVLPLLGIRRRIIPQGFLTMQPEDLRGQEATLGIRLATIEIDHQMDSTSGYRLRRPLYVRGCICSRRLHVVLQFALLDRYMASPCF